MSSVADAPLADLYRDATPETAVAFVADLYEARGWTVDRQGERRLVVSADDHERRIGVIHPADTVGRSDLVAWADTVVVPDGTEIEGIRGDVEVLGVAKLRQRLAYGLDRPVARELLRSHFGWSPPPDRSESTAGPEEESGEEDEAGIGGSLADRLLRPSGGQSRMFLAAVVVIAFAGGAFVVMDERLGSGGQGESASDPPTATATPTATPTPTAMETPTPATTSLGDGSEVDPANLPPGIDGSGAIDRVRLTDAHESVLINRSYRLSITYRESVDGRPVGVYTETIRVANDTRYSATVTRQGTLRAPMPTIAETDVYANGSVRFERINGSTVERRDVLSYDRFLTGQTRFLSVFLDVRESAIVDSSSESGTATIYVVTEGNAATLVRNTTGGFHVREDGLVTRGQWSYGFARQLTEYDNVTATFGMRVSDIGSTTVQEPDWVSVNESGDAVEANRTGDTVGMNESSDTVGTNDTSDAVRTNDTGDAVETNESG